MGGYLQTLGGSLLGIISAVAEARGLRPETTMI
jgi:hypothetical protein